MARQEDWLRVLLIKESNEAEVMPVSFIADKGEYCIGILEMEPQQDFGCHKGDEIEFFPYEAEKGHTVLICDMNFGKRFSEAELEDGSVLKAAISTFNRERNEKNFFTVLQLLHDSNVWIPCTAVMGEADQKRLEELVESLNGNFEQLAGMDFVTLDETRLIPDILRSGDALFFPVFSAEEEMGEYGDGFSKVGKSFLEALTLAKNNDNELSGIVVNAFTVPFVVDRELWDVVENMKSRLRG